MLTGGRQRGRQPLRQLVGGVVGRLAQRGHTPAASCVGAGAWTAMRVWPSTLCPFTSTACSTTRPWLDAPSGADLLELLQLDLQLCDVWPLTRSPSTGPWRDRRSVRR